MNASPPIRSRGRPLLIGCLAGLLIVTVAIWLGGLRGLIVPIRVSSGSMAETMLGPHFRLECGDCGFLICYGVECARRDGVVTCPNCGGRTSEGSAVRVDGQRVLIRRPRLSDEPARWQAIAFRSAVAYQVKRIVGLPGEQVAIRDGDLYIDGKIARKSLAELRSVAQLVHDSAYVPNSLNERSTYTTWRAARVETGWRAERTSFLHAPTEDLNDVISDWLYFDYRAPFARGQFAHESTAVLDVDAYNQSLSRELTEVHDLLLIGRIEVHSPGTVAIQLVDGADRFQVELDFGSREIRLFRNDRLEQRVSASLQLAARSLWIETALCDQQVLVAVDGYALLRFAYETNLPRQATARPLAIGCDDASVRISDLRVFRDVHYLHPFGVDWEWSANHPLASDEYFLLGDNSPASLDSRQAGDDAVHRKSLIGQVLRCRSFVTP